jgi:hypothetical protein
MVSLAVDERESTVGKSPKQINCKIVNSTRLPAIQPQIASIQLNRLIRIQTVYVAIIKIAPPSIYQGNNPQ